MHTIASQPFYFEPKTGEFIVMPEKQGELEVVFFKTNVNILTNEKPAIISWEVINASKVRINNKPVALKGNITFRSFEPQTIKIVAENKKKQSIERTLYIGIDKTPPEILYFKANKRAVNKDSVVTLSWHVTGANKISIDNGIGDVAQKAEVKLIANKDIEYKLTAKNYFGLEVHAYLSFSVFPSQLIQSLFVPVPEFTIRSVSLNQLTFDLQTAISSNISIKHPVFTSLIQTTQPNMLATQIILKKSVANSILFPNNTFRWLAKKQKDINQTLELIWKKNMKEKLKNLQK